MSDITELVAPPWFLDHVPWSVDHDDGRSHRCPCRPVCMERTRENYDRRFVVVGGDPVAVAHRQSYADAIGGAHLVLHLEPIPDEMWETLH